MCVYVFVIINFLYFFIITKKCDRLCADARGCKAGNFKSHEIALVFTIQESNELNIAMKVIMKPFNLAFLLYS